MCSGTFKAVLLLLRKFIVSVRSVLVYTQYAGEDINI